MTTSAPTSPTPAAAPASKLDATLAACTLLAGVILAATAQHYNPRAFILFAGLEGSVTIVILGAAIGMFGTLRARAVIACLSPIVALQVAYLIWKSIPWIAPLGIEMAGIGAVTLAGTWVRGLLESKPAS